MQGRLGLQQTPTPGPVRVRGAPKAPLHLKDKLQTAGYKQVVEMWDTDSDSDSSDDEDLKM